MASTDHTLRSLPVRSSSTRSRPTPSTANPDSSSPSSYHSRQPSSTRPTQDSHDYDGSGVAHSKRSNGGDRHPPSSSRQDPSRPHRRSSTRSNHSHHHHHQQPDMPAAPVANGAGPVTATATAPPAHGVAGAPDNRPSATAAKHGRSRTTIPTQSGKWILGKTIGAGSMGKVKLARKEDGSEQVCSPVLKSFTSTMLIGHGTWHLGAHC